MQSIMDRSPSKTASTLHPSFSTYRQVQRLRLLRTYARKLTPCTRPRNTTTARTFTAKAKRKQREKTLSWRPAIRADDAGSRSGADSESVDRLRPHVERAGRSSDGTLTAFAEANRTRAAWDYKRRAKGAPAGASYAARPRTGGGDSRGLCKRIADAPSRGAVGRERAIAKRALSHLRSR